MNVAKFDLTPREGNAISIDVVKLQLNTETVNTVEAMGAAVPVLLCVVDLAKNIVYYVCLNDYVAKILLPANPRFDEQKTVSIAVPAWNVLDPDDESFTYIWQLARRGKLYAAFNTFDYQHHELEISWAPFPVWPSSTKEGSVILGDEFLGMARTFLRTSLRLDIWGPTGAGYWAPLYDIHDALVDAQERLPKMGAPINEDVAQHFVHDLRETFRRAANLGRMYEELVREWRLPTEMAALLDYYEGNRYNPPQP